MDYPLILYVVGNVGRGSFFSVLLGAALLFIIILLSLIYRLIKTRSH